MTSVFAADVLRIAWVPTSFPIDGKLAIRNLYTTLKSSVDNICIICRTLLLTLLTMTTTTENATSETSTATGGSPARRVFIARHGERLDFIDGRYRDTEEGGLYPDDPPLTARGEEQARSISAYLSTHANITSVYASPFRRCSRTATLAAPGNLKVRVEPGLCERLSMVRYWRTEKGPIWRYKEFFQVDNINADLTYKSVMPTDFNYSAYPESTEDLNQRCAQTIQSIIRNDDTGGDILVVGHISSVKALINTLCPNTITYKQVPCKLPLSISSPTRPFFFSFLWLFSRATDRLD